MTHRAPFFALVFLFTACDTEEVVPLSGATVRSSLRETARTHAREGARLIADFLNDGFGNLAFDEVCALTSQLPQEECTPPELEFEQADADEFIDEITDKYFADERIVSETATEVIYRIEPGEVCGTDTECRDAIVALDLLLVARQPAPDSIEVTLRASGYDVFTLDLDPERVSVEVDLAELREAIAEHPEVLDLDPQDIPTADGRVRASIEHVSGRRYLAELEVTEAIDIQHASGAGAFGLSVAAATILSIDAEGDTESLIATVGLGATSARFPASFLGVFYEQPIEGVAGVDLAGLTASVALRNPQHSLTVTGLGLGQTTSALSLDGVDLFAMDLNEGFGRQLDLTVEADEESFAFTFSPAATATADIFLRPLADQGHDIPAWALDVENTARLTATSGSPGFTVIDDRVRVDNGTLELSTDALSEPALIEAGLCVAVDETVDVDFTHPFAAFYGASCE